MFCLVSSPRELAQEPAAMNGVTQGARGDGTLGKSLRAITIRTHEKVGETQMPRSIPDASTLLNAAIKYLDEELMPTLSGYHRFQTRVTVNVLNIIRRELERREAHDAAECLRLRALLGHDGALDELNDELCDQIRQNQVDLNDPSLREHLRQSLADALAINNPKWTAG
jgi:hypothetical protein